MSDRKQVNVNEAALDWLRERDQPINDAMQPAGRGEPKCPKCGGEKNNPCFLWTQTTGWGDVECGPKCDHSFHAKDTPIAPAILARRARALLRANSRPTPPASQSTLGESLLNAAMTRLVVDVIRQFHHCRCDQMMQQHRPCLFCQASSIVEAMRRIDALALLRAAEQK